MKRSVIIGYDPGTTAAVAVIDTNKKILLLKSKRYMKREDVTNWVTGIGKPIIVAGDRYPLPKSVEKLASTLGCKPYHPPESLSNLEKWRLVNEFTEKIRNDHEKDALASVLKAFEKYSRLFKKTDRILSYLGLMESYDKVLEMIILEKADNITDAVNTILNEMREKREVMIESKKKPLKEVPKEFIKLRKELKQKENDILILKKYNEALKRKLEIMKNQVKNEQRKPTKKSDLKIEKMRKTIDVLREKLEKRESLIERLKSFRKLESEGYIPIIEIEKIWQDRLATLHRTIGLEDGVLFIKSFNNIHMLNDYNIKAIITQTELDQTVLQKLNFPVINRKDISIEKIENISVIGQKEFEEKLKKARKVGLVQWLEVHKKRRL